MKITDYFKNTLSATVCALSLLGHGVASAQSDDPAILISNNGFVTTLSASLAAARYQQDENQYIHCKIIADAASNTIEMSCDAQDAFGNAFYCRSSEKAHINAITAMSADSIIRIDNDHPEQDHCGNLSIGVYSGNSLLPAVQK